MNRTLGIDPGGKRLGWAVLANPQDRFAPVHVASGVYGLDRREDPEQEDWQVYRLRLVEHFTVKSEALIMDYLPVTVVTEIVPAVGGGNFIAATQSELAKTGATIFQSAGFASGLRVRQLGANTIKKRVTGNHKATKVQVRNKVIEYFPELEKFKSDWQAGRGKAGFDRPDAIATALAYILGQEYLQV
jgi:Holliday junction resolvasome RuvABC endonuclease subunit